MVLFRITENEPSKMHNVRPYVYSRPWVILFVHLLYMQSFIKFDKQPFALLLVWYRP